MNNIFQKNIEAIANKNPELAKKLLEYIPTDTPKLVQENGAYNYIYKEKHIHNRQNPLGEAREIFFSSTNNPVSIHLIYGLGLGYLFQVACANSKGAVILYEPDLNILWCSMTLVDFSADITKPNVFIGTTFEEISKAIHQKFGTKNSPQMLSIPSQHDSDPEAFDNLVTKLQTTVGSYNLDLKYAKEKFYPALKMLIKNIPHLMKEVPLAYSKDSCKNKTAVVVSAGPTLDRNIETLKKNRDKFVLFTVGTALKTLITHGITPDFLCIIETFDSSKQISDIDLSGINFITEPYSNPALRNFEFKKVYSHISANSPINFLWADICGENIEEYWSKGTVSYTALNCARLLGCSKIILVGQDLAYIGGQCYSKDSAYKDLCCEFNPETNSWEITAKDFEKFAQAISPSQNPAERAEIAQKRLSDLNKSLYYVKGIDGTMLPTESVYAAFVNPLQEFAKHFNNLTYINTSMVGAQIDGFENIPLEDALANCEPVGNITLSDTFEYNKTSIKTKLQAQIDELKQAQTMIDEGLRIYRNLSNETVRAQGLNEKVLKCLKSLSLNYLELSGNFSNKSKIFDFITVADKIVLDYEMKMITEFNPQNVKHISDKIAQYYKNAQERIIEIEKLIEGVLNESFNTES